MQRRNHRAPPFVALRILLFQARSDQIQLRLRLLLGHVRFQTRDDASSQVSAAKPEAFRREADGHGDVGFLPELEIGRSNPDDGEALIVECELFPDDTWIITKPAPPESVTQDHRWNRARTVLFREKVAPEQRLDAQSGEELRRDKPSWNAFRFTRAHEVETL